MTAPTSLRRRRWPRDDRGEALPAAILFVGVLVAILVGVHVVTIALARTAVQAAADSAVVAAQSAGPATDVTCHDGQVRSARECEALLAARVALLGNASAVVETRPPAVAVEPDRGIVSVLVVGGVVSPVLGEIEVAAQACGPLEDVLVSELSGADAWRC